MAETKKNTQNGRSTPSSPRKLAVDSLVKWEKAGKYTIDLKSVNREILLRAGLCEENIDVSELCTACRDDLFYSHRKSGGERGSLCAAIML